MSRGVDLKIKTKRQMPPYGVHAVLTGVRKAID